MERGSRMEALISIIVPVYNSVRYIRQCVESVRAQTCTQWELFLMDDGSQDSTREICRELCEQDHRIRLFCLEHKGVSAARNAGIKEAKGNYLFFLDSDDMIHPALTETLCRLMEESGAAVAAEACCLIEGEGFPDFFGQTRDAGSIQEHTYFGNHDAIHAFVWNTAVTSLKSIGGKMICRDALGKVKFDERLSNGEDTLFIYQLLLQGADVVVLPYSWYYYRRHEKGASRVYSLPSIQSRYRVWQYIRRYEVKNGRMANAVQCENIILNRVVEWYTEGRRRRDRSITEYARRLAGTEKGLHIFSMINWCGRLRIWLILYCRPLYWLLHTVWCKVVLRVCAVKQKLPGKTVEVQEEKHGKSKAGILTFHCADNYGAMLQAYGLKRYLCKRGIKTEIVRYEPFFMTGRHWWIPYFPAKNILGRIWYTGDGWVRNLRIGKAFSARKRNMRLFRETFLVEKTQKKFFFLYQFKRLPYTCYIVGSDQIWNPGITCGLRKAYFGAFKNRNKKKVVAYAASLGGESLPTEYRREFSELLKYVDVVSVREQQAVPYVQSLYHGSVTAVLDPVLLLGREEWQSIERRPEREGYILVYITEKSDELITYVKELSKEKGLPVVELRSNAGVTDKDFLIDYTAGPAEFLGYLHRADHVVTNSFHGTVFSIIYQKEFTVFPHSRLGARISNILRIHGLEHRIYGADSWSGKEAVIDWEDVKKHTEENVKVSEEFLLKYVAT